MPLTNKGLQKKHQEAQEEIQRLESLLSTCKEVYISLGETCTTLTEDLTALRRDYRELERRLARTQRHAQADVASQALVLHDAQLPLIQIPIHISEDHGEGNIGTVVFSRTASVSLQINNV